MLFGINTHNLNGKIADDAQKLGFKHVRFDIPVGDTKRMLLQKHVLTTTGLKGVGVYHQEYPFNADKFDECVRTYGDSLAYYNVINEPNLKRFWGYGIVKYCESISAAAVVVHKHNKKLIGPELSDLGSWSRWMEGIAALLPKNVFDIISMHHYGRTSRDVNVALKKPRVFPWEDECVSRIFPGKPIWITEFGMTRRAHIERSEADRTRYLIDMHENVPVKMFYYHLQDDPRPMYLWNTFGLIDAKGMKTRLYHTAQAIMSKAR